MQEGTQKVNYPWRRRLLEGLIGLAIIMVLLAISIPNLLRSRTSSSESARIANLRTLASAQQAESSGAAASYAPPGRMVVIVGAMNLVASQPFKAARDVEAMVRRFGGYVGSMERFGPGVGHKGYVTMTLRIPEAKFDAARTEVYKLGSKVVDEKVDAQDVTARQVDMASTLRNYRVEEEQYLAVMKRTGVVKDTLEVVRQLSDVRGRIEKLEGELRVLTRQVQFATLALSITAEPMPVASEWRPWLNARRAVVDAGSRLADYADFMVMLLINLPLFVLWPVTVITIGGYAWKVAVFTWRRWLGGLFVKAPVRA